MAELVWEGKYDAEGRKVGPVRLALPFQTVETLNETTASRQQRDLFAEGAGEAAWRNRLIWGDKKYVLPALLPEFAGKVDLIYIDPPFNTGGDFSFTAAIPPEEDGDGASFVKEASAIEKRAYQDTWGAGRDSFLQWFYETVTILRDFLTDRGSMFVHLDTNESHYCKAILDEVFGTKCFQNEIIWQRTDAHNDAKSRFGDIHDVIFWYGRNPKPSYHHDVARADKSEGALAEYSLYRLDTGETVSWREEEEREEIRPGRRFKLDDCTWKGSKNRFVWRGATPGSKREWRYKSVEEMDTALERGEFYLRNPEKGVLRCLVSFLDEKEGTILQSIWQDVGRMKGGSTYATEKPEPLLARVIRTTTKEGDLVLDCFSGSGTTAAVAEKLGRRWIAADLGRFAIHTTRKRLLAIKDVKPFDVLNLGRYERQAWQVHRFGEDAATGAEARTRAYRAFILRLYGATPLEGYAYLHGMKAGRAVHVGAVDSPVSREDIAGMTREFRRLVGTGENAPTRSGIDVLGWDFAFETNETAEQTAERAGISLRNKVIPREVMERRAKEDPEGIVFYEAAAVAFDLTATGRTAALTLTDFLMPMDGVPQSVVDGISHWAQWIDYWAVDWESGAGPFHNMDQAYRTKAAPKLVRTLSHTYEAPGTYTVTVKVVDQMGNDTTKTGEVTVL